MSDIGQSNIGSELNSSSDEDLVPFSAFTRKEFEVIAIRTIEKLIKPILEPLTRNRELEVIVIRTIEKLIGPVLEPLIRKVVKEKIDAAREMIMTSLNQASAERPSSSAPTRLKLRFRNRISAPVLTGQNISGDNGNALTIELVDENTNVVVKNGPQSSGRVEILALRVDTKRDQEEGNSSASLLNGCTIIDLKDGIGMVGKISFPQRSNWTRICNYILVARFVGDVDGISVVEAKSEVFMLKDNRNQNYGKHYPPTLSDKVLHLDNIAKGGPFEKRLLDEKIMTVENFLREYFKNRQRLKEVLNMPEKKFNDTIRHALTCEELKEKYIYYIPGSEQQMGILLNIVGELFGLVSQSQFVPVDSLSEIQKDECKRLVASALEHWGHVIPYKEHSFPSSSNHLISNVPTLIAAVCGNTQPCTSSMINISPPILVGGYQSDDHTRLSTSKGKAILPNISLETSQVNGKHSHAPPITPCANGTLFDILLKTSVLNGGHDHRSPNTFCMTGNTSNILIGSSQANMGYGPVQPKNPYVNATLSDNLVGTPHINGGNDQTQMFSPNCSNETSHENCQYEEVRQVAAPEDITPLNDTFSYPFVGFSNGIYSGLPNLSDMDFGYLDDFQWGSTMSNGYLPDDIMHNPGVSIDNYFGPDERLKKDSKARINKWRQMFIVLQFAYRMKMEKEGRAPKRARFN